MTVPDDKTIEVLNRATRERPLRTRNVVLVVLAGLLFVLVLGGFSVEAWRQNQIRSARHELEQAVADLRADYSHVANWQAWYAGRVKGRDGSPEFRAWVAAYGGTSRDEQFESLQQWAEGGPGSRAAREHLLNKFDEIAKNCFAAGTLVWVLKDGLTLEEALELLAGGAPIWAVARLMAIQSIKQGQYVLSRHESSDTSPLTFSRVAFTTTRLVDELVDVTVVDPASRSAATIRTTPGHAFWSWAIEGKNIKVADTRPHETEGLHYVTTSSGATLTASKGWTFATDLKPDQNLAGATRSAGYVARTATIRASGTRVYNFAVEGTWTYFVTGTTHTGTETPVWVHNTNHKKPASATTTGKTSRAARREAMREAGIPTSQQPLPEKAQAGPRNTAQGKNYEYEVDGKRQACQQTANPAKDETHGPHWEAGEVKEGGQKDALKRPRLKNNKSRVEYDTE